MKTLKTLKFAALGLALLALTACNEKTPEEVAARKEWKSDFYSNYIKRNSFEVCVHGNTYLYLESGNTSQAILILDKAGKVIPCKEATQ